MLKIEKVSIPEFSAKSDGLWNQFIRAVKTAKKGDSFVVPKLPSNFRSILAATPILLDAEFITRKDPKGVRVWRIK